MNSTVIIISAVLGYLILDNISKEIELNKKLLEEVNEYLESGEVSELCDIEEVLRLIISLKGLSFNEFEVQRTAKNEKRGSFTKRLFLESEEDND